MSDGNGHNFSCQHCYVICDWDTRRPVADQQGATWKTIGNKFCDEPACVTAEAEAHGLPVERVMAWHR